MGGSMQDVFLGWNILLKKIKLIAEHGEEEGKSGMSYCFSILESWIYLLTNGH